MANSQLRTNIREVATYIASEPAIVGASTTRSDMKYIQLTRYRGLESPYQPIQWIDGYWEKCDGSSGTFEFSLASSHTGADGQSNYFVKSFGFGEGRRYFYEDGDCYDPALLTRASDFADDGVSDYYDIGTPPADVQDTPPPGTGQPQVNQDIVQIPADTSPTSRFTLNLPDFICKTADARAWLQEWIGGQLAALEQWLKGLPDQVHSGEYIRQMCLERDLLLGGYETTSQLQDLLRQWRQILSYRGTEWGILDETNRIHNADDAAIEYKDFDWYLGVTYPGDHEADAEVDPVIWNAAPVIQITVTHNNAFLWPYAEARRVIRDKLIPVDLELLLIQEPPDEDAPLGFGQSEFGTSGFGD